MKNENEVFLEEIKFHVSSNATPQPRRFKRTRLMGKLSPMGIFLFVCAIAGALLIGSLYSVFYAQQKSYIELNGAMRPLFQYNSQPFTGAYYNGTCNVTTMDPGQTITLTNDIYNEDEGCWLISITDNCDFFYDNESHMWYGFTQTFNNFRVDGIPRTTETFFVAPGQHAKYDTTMSLNAEFVESILPLPYNVSTLITRADPAPLAVDDTYATAGATDKTLPVLSNDIDYQNNGLIITSVTQPSDPNILITIKPGGQELNCHLGTQTPTGSWQFSYTITAGLLTDTATVFITNP